MNIESDSEVEGPTGEGDKGLRQELEKEKQRNGELLTRLKYVQADLENYRKRSDKEVKEAGEASVRSLVARLLVVLDELALAVKHAEAAEPEGELKEGVEMVQRNLGAALESIGVEKIDCVGKPFDPSLHEAVEKVQGSSRTEDIVVEELRPGYMIRGQLIRPSMVKVELAVKAAKEEARANE